MRLPLERSTRTCFTRWLKRAVIAAGFLSVAGMIGPACINAQETVGYSLSRQLRTQPRPSLQRAFITLGPFRGQMGAGLGITADDNANLASSGTQSEVRFNQELDFDLRWVLTYLNELHFQLGAVLSEVVGGDSSRALDLAIQPGSNIELRLFAGDFLIRVYDYMAVLQDPTQDPAVSNQSTLSRLTNDSGISVEWNLDPLILSARFDYSYSTDQSSGFSSNQPSDSSGDNRSTLRPALSASYTLSPEIYTGLELAYLKSLSSGSNNVDAVTVGPFLHGRLTPWMTVGLAGGLEFLSGPNVDPVSYFLSLGIWHQLTRSVQYGLSFTRDLEFSIGNALSENNNFTLAANIQLGRAFSLGADGFVNFGKVPAGQFTSNPALLTTGVTPGNFVQYGAGLQLACALSRKITAALSYRFITRDADEGNYKQNRVDFSVYYSF